ncbi:MAG: hypothetical protein II057_01680, partial [Clostridia bacterium]|nr:hypothetical protein [Clostridia bacterium]
TLYDWYTKETQKRLDYFDESEEFDFMVDDMVGSIYENISRSFWKAVRMGQREKTACYGEKRVDRRSF